MPVRRARRGRARRLALQCRQIGRDRRRRARAIGAGARPGARAARSGADGPAVRHRRGRGCARQARPARLDRSEEHTSELQSLMRISYAVFCLKKKKKSKSYNSHTEQNKKYNSNVKVSTEKTNK